MNFPPARRSTISRVLLAFLALYGGSLHALEVGSLECEARSAPLGVDVPQPRLGWICSSETRGDKQTAYRILVASSAALLAQDNGDLWDSGKVVSSAQGSVPYNGSALQTGQQVFWKVRVWDANDAPSAWSSAAGWTMGVLSSSDWQAQWIGLASPPTGSTNAPGLLVRRAFNVNAGLKRATIFVCGLGSYTLTVNGSRVTPDLLEPGWTDYTKTVLYQTYDITSALQAGGANAVGLSLGHGVYQISAAPSGRYVKPELSGKSFGPLKAIAQIRLEYADGTSQTIATDQNWQVGTSPVTFDNLYAGEDYDARLEIAGWDSAGATLDSSWQAATIVSGPGGVLKGVTHAAPPVRVQQVLPPASVQTLSSTVKVYDLGQNASIMPSLVVSGPAGSSVRVIPSELLASNGTVDRASCTQSPGGSAWWQYTLKGTGTEAWSPQFFTHGSRYLQVELIPAQSGGTLPVVQSLTANVIRADSPVTGSFQTSSTLFNNIWQLVRWAQCNNMLSVMTDCPHRERMPWLGDNELNNRALRYNFDLRPLLSKASNDMADSQYASGFVPNIAPEFFQTSASLTDAFHNSPEWGGAVVVIPWEQYQFDGDLAALAAHYQEMKDYVAFLASTASGNIISTGLGDWYDTGPNPPWGSQLTPVSLTATAHYFYFNRILSQVATLLGNTADATSYSQKAENIRTSFNAKFFNTTTGTYSTGSQTANALPLQLGMPDAQYRAGVLDAVISDIRNHGNALTSGIVGHPYLLRALAEAGRSDVLFAIYSQTDKPGYGMQLARGATALTEKWDASVGSFGSQDHYMQGPINEWFFHDLAGIQPDPAAPGFRHIVIKPSPCGDLTSCKATYGSVLGPITSDWSIAGGTLTTKVSIPPGTTATVYVPSASSSVTESGTPAAEAPGVEFLRQENGAAVYEIGSGSYVFGSTPAPTAPGIVSASASSGQVALTWGATLFADGYSIKRATTPGGPYTTVATNVTATSFTDPGLANGVTYYYVVTAGNASGESGPSDQVSGTPGVVQNAGFEAPTIATYFYNPTVNGWTFSPQSGGNGAGIASNGSAFTSSNANAPEGTQVAFLQGTGSATQTFSGLTPGVTYTLLFAAAQRATGGSWNANGQTWKITVDGSTIASYAPAEAATAYANYSADFTATAASHTVAFVGTNTRSGDNTVFIDNVRLVRSASTGLLNAGFESPSLPTYQYNPGGASWTFQAESGSNGSGIARNASLVTGNNPNAPEGVQVAFLQGNGTITQTVDGLTPGMRYHLLFSSAQRATYVNGGQTWNVTLDGATVASFKPGASPTAYTGYAASFTATATSHTLAFVGTNTNTGDNTALIDDVRLSPGSPAAPAALSAVAGNEQVQLGWSAVSGATGYVITRSTSGGADAVLSGIGTQTTFTDSGLTNGVTYSYRVSAADESGAGPSSNPAAATPVSPPVTEQEKSAPVIALNSGGGGNPQAVVTIPASVSGHFYTLQSCTDLSAGDWQAVSGFDSQEGTGGALQFVVPLQSSARQRFFRILIQP